MEHPNATQLRQAADNHRAEFRYRLEDGSYSPPVSIITVLLNETKHWELVDIPTFPIVEESFWCDPFILKCVAGVICLLGILGYLSYPEALQVIR